MQIEKGDKLKLVSLVGLVKNGVAKKFGLKLNEIYVVQDIKSTGGIILEGVNHTYNLFGEIQGLLPLSKRFKLIKK